MEVSPLWRSPSAFQTRISFNDIDIALCMDVLTNEKIEKLEFKASAPTVIQAELFYLLESMCKTLPKMSLEQVMVLDEKLWKKIVGEENISFFLQNLSFLALAKLLDLYTGKDEHYWRHQQKVDLICRCFGVEKKTLEQILENDKELSIKDLTSTTCAGGGCRRCLPQIKKIWLSFQ